MRAVVYSEPRNFSIIEVPDPRPAADEVLVRITLAGVCGTDLHLHAGEFGPTYPLTPGHEFVGQIVELGAAVTSLKVGQRVCADNTTACGRCDNCRRARPTFCRQPIAQGVNAQGGFAELISVRSDKCFVVDDLADEVAVFAEPTACVLHGLDMLGLQPGADVLLFGAGPTGLLLSQLLARGGAGSITVAAPTRFKLDVAARGGADRTVLIDRSDPIGIEATVRATAPDGFDVVIDATGSLRVLENCLGLTRDGGTVFVYGMTGEDEIWNVSPYEVFRRELTIKGSFAQCYSFDRAVAALRSGRADPSEFITHRFGLSDFAEALDAVAASSCLKAVIDPSRPSG